MPLAARTSRGRMRLLVAGIVSLTVLARAVSAAAQEATPTAELAAPAIVEPGAMTTVRPFILPLDGSNLTITPLLTTGEMVGDYQMAGVPDGLGAVRAGDHVILLMNHELSVEDDGLPLKSWDDNLILMGELPEPG